jgi:predicted CoA-binding protein
MEQKLLEQLEGIFNPRSVAIVGVSNREYNLGYRWLKSLQDAGFPTLYPVNPKGGEMLGLKVYPSIADIPDDVDLAILLIPREAVPDVARDCARKRTKGIVLYTSGFRETGTEGRKFEDEIVKIAREGGTRHRPKLSRALQSVCQAHYTISFSKGGEGSGCDITQRLPVQLSCEQRCSYRNRAE